MEIATARILDANLNRLREALRVIEEHARFALDDAAAAGEIKQLRHQVRTLAAQLGPGRLLTARDIICDAGRDTKTPSELSRGSSEDVVRAAFGRATEAARVISEYAKLESAPAAELAEQLRYRTYELEQCVVLRAKLRSHFSQARLYVIVTEALCRIGLCETAAAALQGGAGCLQLREKTLSDGELLDRARRLREITREHDALLIINDRPDIARLCGADGVHLGQDDLSVANARTIAGGHMLVGKSTHTIEQFEAALRESPDYIAVGPMFQSPTKPQKHISGLVTLRAVAPQTDLPIVAIGGITVETVTEVRAAGADCICVCSAVISSAEPSRAARRLVDAQ